MRLEADRMSNLIVVQKELVPERQVVLEERRMRTDNVPGELLNEAVRDALFGRGRPYGVPVVVMPTRSKSSASTKSAPSIEGTICPTMPC